MKKKNKEIQMEELCDFIKRANLRIMGTEVEEV
jgi:hypothetical protein